MDEMRTSLRSKWKDFATLQHRTRKANSLLVDLRTRLALAKRKRNKILDRGSEKTEEESKELREATKTVQGLENEIDSATLTLSSLRADEKHVKQLEKELLEESKVNSRKIEKSELRAAASMISKRVAKHRAKMRLAEKFKEKHTKLAKTAKNQNRLAVKRLKKMLGNIQKTQDLVEKDKSQTYESRTNAYIALKNNVDRMFKEMKASNEVNREREEIRAMVQKQKFDKILQEGRNPYEVFRKKRVDRAYENQRQRLLDDAKNSAEILQGRIEKEKEYQKQKDEEEARERRYQEKYQQEMGRSVVEKRVERYLRSKTLNGDDMLDTTGHVYNLFPSQLTNIKDPSFGTGYDTSERTEAVLKRLSQENKIKLDKRLIPRGSNMMEGGRGFLDGKGKNSNMFNQNEEKESRPGDSEEEDEDNADLDEEEEELIDIDSQDEDDAPKTSLSTKSPRKLTRLEEKMMQNALERQKSNVLTKQIVMGREFKGDAFLPSPKVLVFEDFVVNEPLHLKLVLTNVSFTFNTFRLLELPDEVKNFFEITYTRPGRMSAGKSCTIDVEFTPKVSDEIETYIPFLAHTGPFRVPVRCLRKKAEIEVTHRVISFKGTVMGDTDKRNLIIRNVGSLSTRWRLTSSSSNSSIKFPDSGIANANEVCLIPFEFSPKTKMNLEHTLRLEFLDEDSCEDVTIRLVASSVDVPVYVEDESIDMKCCVYEKLYRTSISLRNRANTALKMRIKTPNDLKNVLTFTPEMGFVQARSSHDEEDGLFRVQLKFRAPNPDSIPEKYHQDEEGKIVQFPIKVLVAGQTLPAKFVIRARMTTSNLLFDPPSMRFPPCLTSQEISIPLTITNESDLPQRFGFVNLPKCITVSPDEGFGTILPNDSVTCDVVYRPRSAVAHSMNLTLKTSLNREFKILCSGLGVEPLLNFSHTIVSFCPASAGDRMSQSLYVRNTSSSETRTMQFVVPKDANIKMNPVVANVLPNETIRVTIDFLAPNDHKLGTYVTKIACIVKDHDDSPAQFLEIRKTVVERSLVAEPSSVIEFGETSVGNTSLRKVVLKNQSNDTMFLLLSETLNPPFSILNALRPIESGKHFEALVEFAPTSEQKYKQSITLSNNKGKGRVTIDLSGVGVSPKLRVEPSNPIVSLGHVLSGGVCRKSFRVLNDSDYPLNFSVNVQNQDIRGTDGNRVFDVSPPRGFLKARETCQVVATFAPDRERFYDCELSFELDRREDQRHVVKLEGYCWERQVYVVSNEEKTNKKVKTNPFRLPEELVALYVPDLLRTKSSRRRIELVWDRDETTKTVSIGSCDAIPSKKSSSGSFELILPPNFGGTKGSASTEEGRHAQFFSVDTNKSNLNPGGEVDVTFSFKVPDEDPDKEEEEEEVRVGQWIETTVTCKIKGGFVVEEMREAEEEVDIVLRAYGVV